MWGKSVPRFPEGGASGVPEPAGHRCAAAEPPVRAPLGACPLGVGAGV